MRRQETQDRTENSRGKKSSVIVFKPPHRSLWCIMSMTLEVFQRPRGIIKCGSNPRGLKWRAVVRVASVYIGWEVG